MVGWKNQATGTICQTVTADDAVALFEAVGLEDQDPTQPYGGFCVVPVRKVQYVEERVKPGCKHKKETLVTVKVEEVV